MKGHRILTFVLALALLLSLAPLAGAQGEARATFSLPTTPATEGPLAGVDPSGATVVYWHQHSGDRETVLNEMVAEFNEGNPWGITVEASNQGGYGDIYEKMIAGIASGELPNLVVAYQNNAAAYAQEEALVDLNIYVDDPQWGLNEAERADFIPAIFEQDINPQFNNARLGFPPNRSMESLYVNLDGLAELGYDAPPTTWAEFQEMACAWTESGENRVGYSVRTDASFIAAAAFSLGGDIFDYENIEYNYTGEEVAYVLGILQDMIEQGCANRIAENYADQNDFAASRNLFYIGSSSGLPFVASAIAESEAGEFNWTIAPLPYADEQFGQTTPTQDLYGASVSIPVTTPEQQLAAWLFVRWFTEPEQMIRWAQASQYFTPRISVAEQLAAEYLETNPQYAAAYEVLNASNVKVEPPIASYDPVRRRATELFNAILDGADVAETLATLTEEANQILAEFSM